MGRTRRWLEALYDYEAKNKRTHNTSTIYIHRDNDAQDNQPAKYSEALEWVTDKTDKNLDQPDTEMANKTLAYHRTKTKEVSKTTS